MHRSHILCIALTVGLSATVVSCPRPVAERTPPRANTVEGLAAQLRDADWRKRVAAARKLGATGRPDAVAPLAGALGDKDKRVRLAVVWGLARIGNRAAAEAMIGALDGASMWLRPEVADGLAKLDAKVLAGLEVAAQILVVELDPAQQTRFRRLAKALAAVGEPALVAILGLGKLTTNRARESLKRLAKSRHKAIAKAAGEALNGRVVTDRGLGPLGIAKIGIPECDRYLAVFACYVSKMPPATQGPVTAAFQKTIAAYRKMAAGAGRASLAKSCKMALDAWRKAVSKMPKYRSCFGP